METLRPKKVARSGPPGEAPTETAEEKAAAQMLLDFDTAPPAVVEAPDWRTQVPSVSQLTRRLRGHIEGEFFDVWVRGEVSNFRKPISGHAYFIVKDAGAQLRTCMFRPMFSKVKFQLQDGMDVLVHGKVTVYEARGDYQIIADTIEPMGLGALQAAFEQLKKKLQAEGLFDPKRKKALPFLPKRIGVITSATGAAVRDILKVLHGRFRDREILIFPASVQGEKAAPEIVRAIEQAQRWNLEQPHRALDVLIIGRGGGSLEDLWPFNEEAVARAISGCVIPTISAVGHEVDVTIADYVADVRAATPSNAAERVVPRKEELKYQVDVRRDRLSRTLLKQIEQLKLHVGHLTRRVTDPRQRIQKYRQDFSRADQRMKTSIRIQIERARHRLQSDAQLLHSLSPLQVVGRGYSITQTTDGKVARSVKSVRVGEEIRSRLSDGSVISRVVSVELPSAPDPV